MSPEFIRFAIGPATVAIWAATGVGAAAQTAGFESVEALGEALFLM